MNPSRHLSINCIDFFRTCLARLIPRRQSYLLFAKTLLKRVVTVLTYKSINFLKTITLSTYIVRILLFLDLRLLGKIGKII